MGKFKPVSAEEANKPAQNLWPKGYYDFEIAKAEDTVSKTSGKDMIKLNLKVFNSDGDYIWIFDYITFDESMAWKLRHCCESIGILDKYDGGELEAGDFESGAGRLELQVQVSRDPKYPDDKNSVKDYCPAEIKEEKPKKAATKKTRAEELSDDIPF